MAVEPETGRYILGERTEEYLMVPFLFGAAVRQAAGTEKGCFFMAEIVKNLPWQREKFVYTYLTFLEVKDNI